MKEFIFTSENLLDNLDKLGPWSNYGLSTEALQFYFPKEYDEDGDCFDGIEKEVELCRKLGCKNWTELIIKYHKEIGYKCFNPEYVNIN